MEQTVLSANDALGHWDVHGLSASDPYPRPQISVCTVPKEVDMSSLPMLVTAPHMSVRV